MSDFEKTIESMIERLNPYSTGRYSMSRMLLMALAMAFGVLILILLEDTL